MEESATHLFLHCEVAAKVWHMVLNWVNLNFITPPNLATHLDCWFNEVCAKKSEEWIVDDLTCYRLEHLAREE